MDESKELQLADDVIAALKSKGFSGSFVMLFQTDEGTGIVSNGVPSREDIKNLLETILEDFSNESVTTEIARRVKRDH